MPPVHFKLSKPNGVMRKVAFQELPSWPELAVKLHTLFDIPLDRVGVSYLDSDNDEITASSQEELQDYYQSLYKPGNAIKLNVVDITVNCEQQQTPHTPGPERHNGFGIGVDAFEFIDHHWHGISPVDLARTASDGPHAFVEVLSSDASALAKDEPAGTDFESEDAQSTVHPLSYADKGKQRERASSVGAASTVSVLAEELPEKPPIHVADHSQRLAPSQAGGNDEVAETVAHSTPKAVTPEIAAPVSESAAEDQPKALADIDDPPLPSLDDSSAPNTASQAAHPSLSHDVASLLQTFTHVIASHPELSEGVRNIVNNATRGTYWQSHRDALSQAVSGLSQSVDPQEIEAEAGRRVAHALGSIFRSLSGSAAGNDNASGPGAFATGGTTGAPDSGAQPAPDAQPSSIPPAAQPSVNASVDNNPAAAAGNGNQQYPWYGVATFPGAYPPGIPPPPPPPPHAYPPPPPAFHPGFPNYIRPQPFPAPPGPPPAPQQPGTGAPVPASQPSGQQVPATEQVAMPPPTGPPPPPGGAGAIGAHRAWSLRGRHHHHRFGSHGGGFFPPPPPPIHVSTPPPPPAPPVAATTTAASQAGTSMPAEGSSRVQTYNPFAETAKIDIRAGEQQLREGIEQAKRAYKAQKEAYRMLREERKKEKERENQVFEEPPAKIDIAALSLGETPKAGPSRIGRDSWSNDVELPTAGAPRRNHTHLGHGQNARRTAEKKPEDLAARAHGRVAKRLADMGFSEATFPDLPAKIKSGMPVNGVISKEREDDVVTTLLEELLARSGRSPVASGSKDGYPGGPGAWRD